MEENKFWDSGGVGGRGRGMDGLGILFQVAPEVPALKNVDTTRKNKQQKVRSEMYKKLLLNLITLCAIFTHTL